MDIETDKYKLNEDDFETALDGAMVTDELNEGKQATSKVVFNFDVMTISESGLTSVHKNGQWLTYDIMVYTLCHAEFEYIKNNVDPGKNMVPL